MVSAILKKGVRYGVGLFACVGLLPLLSQAQVSVLTRSYNNQRTGSNTNETLLTPANVNVNTFGKLFSRAVDGHVYAQPLYVPNLTIGGVTHNVLFVVTMHDSVYAFDADDPEASAALWKTSYLTTIDGTHPPAVTTTAVPTADYGGYNDIKTEIGIVSTPVIDAGTGTMYVVVRTKETGGADGTYVQRIHALDITTGLDKMAPVVIKASISGTGSGSSGGVLKFDPYLENQRPGLLLDHGSIYLAWASQGDGGNYHGWVMAYDAATLTQKAVFCSSPDNVQGGIWQSGQGPAADAAGNIYVVVGNGDSSIKNKPTAGTGYANALIKMKISSGNQFQILDWFMPYNTDNLNAADADSTLGPTLLPGPNGKTYVVMGGKNGYIYVMDSANLGKYNPNNTGSPQNDHQILESFQNTTSEAHGSPVYFVGDTGTWMYVWGEGVPIKSYAYNGTSFNTTPASQSTFNGPQGDPGGILALSSHGTKAGIVWANIPVSQNANQATVPGILRAFDATDLTKELWNSRTNQSRDDFGNFAKFCPPVVANGKVYLATFSGQVVVYGLLSAPAAPVLSATVSGTTANLSWAKVTIANNYVVKRSTSANGTYTTLNANVTALTYTDSSLPGNTTYYYKIAAVNALGSSPDSNIVSITTAPTPPTGLTAYAGNTQIALNWNPTAGATSYTLLRAAASGGPYVRTVAANLTTTSYTNIGLANNVPYYYVVTATNAIGTTGYSNEASGTPQSLLNGATVSLLGNVNLEQSVNLVQSITFLLRPNDGTAAVTTTALLDANGNFAINGINPKAYKVAIKGTKWLQKVIAADTTNGTQVGLSATLPAGDANNDNIVNIGDFGLFINAYGTQQNDGTGLYDPNCDFNCDGSVDLGDFGLLVNNYGTAGDP